MWKRWPEFGGDPTVGSPVVFVGARRVGRKSCCAIGGRKRGDNSRYVEGRCLDDGGSDQRRRVEMVADEIGERARGGDVVARMIGGVEVEGGVSESTPRETEVFGESTPRQRTFPKKIITMQ